MTKMKKTPRIGGRTRRLEEPRGTGAWVLLAVAILVSVGAVLLTLPSARTAEAPEEAVPADSGPPEVGAGQETFQVYLVRHAEKVDDGRDPELSEAGRARAELLADELAEAGIQRIHSTDYLRTRHTAAPLAEVLGLEVELYDPTDLEGFADELREAGGVHLVVGHSNTTPELVEALGGDAVSPIDEAEYDRLYRVLLDGEGTVRSHLERFGERYPGG